MTYVQAATIAARAAAYLAEHAGREDETEAVVHVAALDLAAKRIKAYWGLDALRVEVGNLDAD